MIRTTVATLIFLALAAPLLGQRVAARQPSGVIVREAEQRWLYGRQQPAFTPRDASSEWVRITGATRDPKAKTRTLSLTFSGQMEPGTARLTTDARGRIVHIDASFSPPRKHPVVLKEISAEEELRWSIFDGLGQSYAALPEMRVWDIVPVRSNTRLEVGAHWRDTIDLHASLGGYQQSVRGEREHTIVGDTVIGGVKSWMIRDSGLVNFSEHLLIDERTLEHDAIIDRTVKGTIVSRHVLDPGLGLDRIRFDTTTLAGNAVLRYPDGRSFATPARFERVERIELLSEDEFRAREAKRRNAEGEFSIVMRLEGDAERIARGDPGLVAALLDTLATSGDPASRNHALGLLHLAAGEQLGERIRAALLRAGDTAAVLRDMRNDWVGGRAPIGDSALALMLPIMRDPGIAFAFGLDRDDYYENARQGLLTHPPASTAAATQWPCTLSACRALAAEWTGKGDPRLRSVALIANLTLEPRLWSDTVLAHYAAGDRFLEPAVELIRGVAAAWPAGSHAALPTPGADWRAWSNWMDGENPEYKGRHRTSLARFDQVHVQVIGFAHALTGRDFAAEWNAGLSAANDDSARFVYGSMLAGIGQMPDDPATIASRFESKSALMRALATTEVQALFDRGAPRADSATFEEVQRRVLAVAIDSAAPWPMLDSAARSTARRSPMPRGVVSAADMAYERPAATPGPLVLSGADLAPAVRTAWAHRGVRITDAGWQPKSSESVIIIAVSEVRQIGRFISVTISQDHLTARVDGRGQSWASGTTLYLMRRSDGWVIVSAGGWVT